MRICGIMRYIRLYPASLQAFPLASPILIHLNFRILRLFQPIHFHAICPPVTFKDKPIKGFLCLAGLTPSFDKYWHGLCHYRLFLLTFEAVPRSEDARNGIG